MTNLHIPPLLDYGTRTMLAETAPPDLIMLLGSEAVLTVLWHAGIRIEGAEVKRDYWVRHCAHGRLYEVRGEDLLVIGEREAQGQELVYRAHLQELVEECGPFIREVLAQMEQTPAPPRARRKE